MVVIPAFEAEATLPAVLDGVRAALPGAGLVVVDDGSTDDTGGAARRGGAKVVRHDANLGKGRALASGLDEAVRSGARYVVTMDADGQHPPASAPSLLAALRGDSADVVVGARRRDSGGMPWLRRLSNRLSSALLSRALGVAIPDSQSGFRAFTATVAGAVHPAGARYEFETEFLVLAAGQGFRLGAVAVPTVYAGARSHFRYGADTARLTGLFLRHWRAVLFGPAGR